MSASSAAAAQNRAPVSNRVASTASGGSTSSHISACIPTKGCPPGNSRSAP